MRNMRIKHISKKLLKERISDPDNQQMIANTFIDTVLRPLSNKKVYERTCQHADKFLNRPDVDYWETMARVIDTCQPATEGVPGHGRDHRARELLNALAVSKDPFVQTAKYKSDRFSGTTSAILHDGATGLVKSRYLDKVYALGHAEAAAFVVFRLLVGVVPQSVRKLIAFAIAGHTDYLAPITIENGYVRQVWDDDIFFSEDKRPIRLAPYMTRLADRLDCQGPALIWRHIVANVDGFLRGAGTDLSGGQFFDLEESMKIIMAPHLTKIGKAPSALLHVLNFCRSLFESPYKKHDHLFVTIQTLFMQQVSHLMAVINAANGPIQPTPFSYKTGMDLALEMIDEPTPEIKEKIFNLIEELPMSDRQRWAVICDVGLRLYRYQVQLVVDAIGTIENRRIMELVDQAVNQVC